jgi:hypothetical protein
MSFVDNNIPTTLNSMKKVHMTPLRKWEGDMGVLHRLYYKTVYDEKQICERLYTFQMLR